LLSNIKDPWRIFTAAALVILIGLIIVPQIWIARTSVQQQGGAFDFKADSKAGTISLIKETVKGYDVETKGPNLYYISRNGIYYFSIRREKSGSLILSAGGDKPLKASIRSGGTVIVKVRGSRFNIRQKVFSSFFSTQKKVTPLFITKISNNSIRLNYSRNAFLSFIDRQKHYTLTNYLVFLTRSRYVKAIVNSLIVTVVSTFFAALIGITLAYFLSRYSIPGTNTILVLFTMASVSPPFLGAYAWRMLLGSYGIITRIFGLHWTIVGIHGVIWVIIWLVFPIIFLLSYDSFTSLDSSFRESSISLGADRRKTLLKIEIPLALPGIITGLYLAMMAAFSDFGTPYIISLNLNVLPVLIYKEYMSEVGSNPSIASTGSILMIFVSTLILTGQRIYLAGRAYASIKTSKPSVLKPSGKMKTLIYMFTITVAFFAFLPHITVFILSFLKWNVGIVTGILTMGNYTKLFVSDLNAIFVSFFLGLSATFLDFIFGIGIAYIIVRKRYPVISNLLGILVMIPYLIPGTVLGLGFILIFNQPPVLLTGTWLILVLAYFIRKLPFSVKSSEASLYQIHPALEEAAKSLGAPPFKSFSTVTLPMMLGGIISGVSLSFLQIMTELSSTIMLYRPPWKPMTAVIFENTIEAGADFGIAASMTVILMLLLYLPLYFITLNTRKLKERRIETI